MELRFVGFQGLFFSTFLGQFDVFPADSPKEALRIVYGGAPRPLRP